MTEIIDLKQEFITAKSRESIVAFAGFRLALPAAGQRDGLLAVSSRKRVDGSGYITLTFMIDTENDAAANQYVAQSFRELRKKGLDLGLGREFETMIEAGVDFEQNQNWFMDTFTFYFDQVDKIKRHHVENKLVPTFQGLLPIQVDPVEWLPDGASVPAPGKAQLTGETGVGGFRKFLQGLFG